MNSDFNTVETLARRLAAERGCDYDRKGAKRAYWRREAENLTHARELARLLPPHSSWRRKPVWRWFA